MTEQGAAYAALITAQLDHEISRRDKIDGRAGAVISSSGAIATLALAVVTLAVGKDANVGHDVKMLLVVAVSVFLLSAALAVLAGLPWVYDVVDESTMTAMIDSHWTDSEPNALNVCSFVRIGSTISLREGNDRKVQLLTAALTAQCLAVLPIGLAVWRS